MNVIVNNPAAADPSNLSPSHLPGRNGDVQDSAKRIKTNGHTAAVVKESQSSSTELRHKPPAASLTPAAIPQQDEVKTADVDMARPAEPEGTPGNQYGAKWAFTVNGKLQYFNEAHTVLLESAFLNWTETVSLTDGEGERFNVDLTKMLVRLVKEEEGTPAGTMCSVARHCSSSRWMTLRMPIAMVPTDHEIEPLQMLSRAHSVRLHYSSNMVWLTGPNNAGDENGPVKTVERLVRTVLQKRQPSADWHFEVPRTKDSKSRYSAYTDVFMVPSDSQEFKELSTKFTESLPNVSIVSIQRIQNLVLWRKFMHEREFLRMKGSPANELMLFYGTQRVNPVFIGHSEIGFDFRLSGDQNYWGRAMYFASSPQYADAYAYLATLRPDGTVDPGTVNTTTTGTQAASAADSTSAAAASSTKPTAASSSGPAPAPAPTPAPAAPLPLPSTATASFAPEPEMLTKQLIVASVLIGEPYYGAPEGFVEGFRTMKRPPRKGAPKLPGTVELQPAPPASTSMPRSCFDEYDSVCGDVLNSRNYAVYAHHRAYPRYIVTYKAPPHIRVQPAAPLRTGPTAPTAPSASSGITISINGPVPMPSPPARVTRSTSRTSQSGSSAPSSSPPHSP